MQTDCGFLLSQAVVQTEVCVHLLTHMAGVGSSGQTGLIYGER